MIRLNKAEKLDLALLLEQGADTPEELAEAFVKRYWELLDQRDNLVCALVHLKSGQLLTRVAVGPVTTVKQAEKAADGIASVPTRFYTPSAWRRHMAELDAPPPSRGNFEEVRKDAAARRNGWDGKDATRRVYL